MTSPTNANSAKVKAMLSEAEVLLLNKPALQLFGYTSYAMEKVILEGKYQVAFTDAKRLYFFSEEPAKFKREQFLGVLIHEVLHVISDHIGRMAGCDRLVANLAADHVVNRVIKEIGRSYNYVSLPDNHVFFEDIEREIPQASFEKVYRRLMDDKKSGKLQIITINVVNGNPGGKEFEIGKAERDGKEYTFSVDTEAKDYSGDKDGDPRSQKEIEEKFKELIEKAKTMWDSPLIQKGNVPDGLSSYLDAIFDVKIPWWEHLQRSVMYYVQSDENPTWRMRNIYYRHIKIPAYIEGKNVQSLVVSIDSSGSMSDTDIARALGIAIDATGYFKSLIVYIHDTIIHQKFVFYNDPSSAEVMTKLNEVKGRGGTSHREVFMDLENTVEDEELSMMIFVTDYDSDVHEIYQAYDFLKQIPSIWVVNNHRHGVIDLHGCDTRTIFTEDKNGR